jgi:hypothetical protein
MFLFSTLYILDMNNTARPSTSSMSKKMYYFYIAILLLLLYRIISLRIIFNHVFFPLTCSGVVVLGIYIYIDIGTYLYTRKFFT